MSDLLPCPFCGSKNVYFSKAIPWESNENVTCKECYVSISSYSPSVEIKSSWNTRASQWISIKERLPTNEEAILMNSLNLSGNFICIGYMDNEKDFIFDGDLINVTHWQPLPTPPKETE